VKIAVIMPAMPEQLASPTLAEAWTKRLQANLDGRCPECGATVTLPNRHERRRAAKTGELLHATMEHENWCVVGDDRMREAMAAGLN